MPSIGRGLAEHLVAYAVLATAAALGYGRRLGYRPLLAMGVGLAGIFELAQLLLPARTFSGRDFLAGVAGAALGVSLAHWTRRMVARPTAARGSPDRS